MYSGQREVKVTEHWGASPHCPRQALWKGPKEDLAGILWLEELSGSRQQDGKVVAGGGKVGTVGRQTERTFQHSQHDVGNSQLFLVSEKRADLDGKRPIWGGFTDRRRKYSPHLCCQKPRGLMGMQKGEQAREDGDQ